MSVTLPQSHRKRPTLVEARLPAVFEEPMPPLPSGMGLILDGEQQMDLLMSDLHRTQPRRVSRTSKR